MALAINGELRGDVELYIDNDWTPLLDPRFLRMHLAGELEPAILEALAGLGRSVRPDDLIRFGISETFSENDLTLAINIPALAMRMAELPMALRISRPKGQSLPVEDFALFLGMSGRVSPTIFLGDGQLDAAASVQLDLSPAINLFSWILEGDFSLSWSGAPAIEIDRARVVKDFPKTLTRLIGGFISTKAVSFQGSAPLYGAAIYKDSSLSGAPEIATSETEVFLLDNKADVTVSLNGILLKKIRLKPGRYRFSDLPLASGMNNLVYTIEEEGREAKGYRLGLPYDSSLLKPDEMEWYAAGGVERQEPWRFFGTSFFAYGFSPSLSAGVQAQYGFGTALGGLTATIATPLGIFVPETSFSSPLREGGFAPPSVAARLAWKLFIPSATYAPRLGLGAEYRAADFTQPTMGQSASAEGSEQWALSAQIGQNLPWKLGNLAAAATVTFEDGGLSQVAASVGLFSSLTKDSSISLSYGLIFKEDTGLEPNVSISLSINPEDRRYLQFNQNLIDSTEYSSLTIPMGKSPGSSISLNSDGLIGAPAGIRLASVRARGAFGPSDWSLATSVRADSLAGTSTIGIVLNGSSNLAFAGGAFGFARSLGDAIAFLVPAPSIGGDKVEMRAIGGAGSGESLHGKPALVANLTPYKPVEVAIDLPESPPDKTPSIERTILEPGYRSASMIKVGWKSFFSARGRAMTREKGPLKTAVGQVLIADTILAASREPQDIFTDDNGTFEAYELEAGPYVIRWGDGSMSTFEIAEGETSEVELGDIFVISPSEEEN